LERAGGIRLESIEVKVKDGVAKLKGVVSDEKEKDEVIAIASAVCGTVMIEDELEIQEGTETF
jgi:osmotically-inducible protein OsmY